MKIAIVSEPASPLALPGGAGSGSQNVYVAHIARQLARAGHQVDVFTRRDHPQQPRSYQWLDDVRVIHVDAGPARFVPEEELLPFMGDFGDRLGDFCSREERPYDVMHANFVMSGLAPLRACEKVPMPLVMASHALGRVRRLQLGESDGMTDERFDIEALLLRSADRILAECPQDKRDLLELYDADPRRIDVVPCGFDPRELWPIRREEARERIGWPKDAFIALHVGRIVPRKGVDNLVRGLAALRREHDREALLYVVGSLADGSDARAAPLLAGLAEAEGVQDHVRFVGPRGREALPVYYGACDVFVTTPRYEPFGITPIEAMACARPVIGSAVSGIRYTVSDGDTGFLVPPGDPMALAAKLAMLHADPLLGRRMGAAGLARARRLFTWSRVARSVALSYRRAIAPRPTERVPLRLRGFPGD